MAKKKPASKQDLSRIDRALAVLIQERARMAKEWTFADQTASPEQTLVRLGELAREVEGPLTANNLARLLQQTAHACRQIAQPAKVAFLGPEYSYSHLATLHRFGQTAELVPVATIAAVFEEVHGGHTAYGVVPIENSTDGRIADTFEMLSTQPVNICGEVQLTIHHYLLARCARDKITQVGSKPQALSQCREWLAKHLPKAAAVETPSTTAAAELAAKVAGAAAIASREAGEHYGLDVVAANIEDAAGNVTRFAVIGREPATKTGDDKTSLLFEIPHKAGALADAMMIFKRQRLNLTWIESFPIRHTRQEYRFFVELEGHPSDLRVRRAIKLLEKKAVRVTILGCYAKTEPVG